MPTPVSATAAGTLLCALLLLLADAEPAAAARRAVPPVMRVEPGLQGSGAARGMLKGKKTVMMWAGISTNATANDEYAAYLKKNSDAINAISPLIWHLAQDGVSLSTSHELERAAAKIKKQSGVRVMPTVFDNESYNQGTLKPRLLKLFASPTKFIDAIVNSSLANGFDGVNLDLEPRWRASKEDAAKLLVFVNTLADAMHKHGLVVSIDASPCVADDSWQGVAWHNNCMWWDMPAYNASRVDSFCNMYTYSNWTSLFTRELVDDVNAFGLGSSKIGLGLDSEYRPTLTDAELEVRFDLLEQLGVREIDIWVSKVPDSWLPYLRKFLAAP